MHQLVTVLLLHLFWFSFALVGSSLLILQRQRLGSKRQAAFFAFLGNTHPLIKFLVAEGLGMALFLPLMIVAFAFQLPMSILCGVYIVTVAAALAGLVYYRDVLIAYMELAWRRRNKTGLAWFAAVVAVLGADALLSYKVGGPMNSDAFVHMAKIHMLADGGRLTLTDPVLGNGVVESRYHINLVLTLHAMVSYILQIPAIDVWRYSLPFWRFLVWISLFTLTWEFVGRDAQRRWSYIVLIVGPVLCSTLFFCADYPDRAVFAWVVLLIVGLKLFLEKRSTVLLFLAAALTTATHPLMAVIAFGFLALAGIVLWLLRLLSTKQARILGLAGVVLLGSAMLTYTFPNRMSESVANMILQLKLEQFGPITLALPVNADPHTWWIWWPLLLAGLVGYVYLVRQARSRALKVALSLLFVYYGLVIYNPVLLTVVGDRVPMWVLNRFQEMNEFRLIISVIGLLAITDWMAQRLKKAWIAPVASAIIVLGFFWYGSPAVRMFASMDHGFNENYTHYMLLKSLTPELKGQRIFTNLAFQQQQLPVVIRTNVFEVDDQNASPMSNMERRQRCAKTVLAPTLRTSDLQVAGITRVMVDTNLDPQFAARAASNTDLTKMKSIARYTVYRVPVSHRVSDQTALCSIPHGQ